MNCNIGLLAFGLFLAINLSAQQKSVTVNCGKEETKITVWDNSYLSLAKELGTVQCGEKVTVLTDASRGSLVRIRTENGSEGFIPERAVSVSTQRANEKQAAKTQKQNEKLQAASEKVCAKHPAWSNESCLLVSQHRVAVGMEGDMVRGSIGIPCHVNTTYREGGHRDDQLVYIDRAYDDSCLLQPLGWHGFNGYIYLEDGVVTLIQTEN